MNSTLIIILGVLGGVIIAGGTIWAFGRSQYKKGRADVVVEAQKDAEVQKRKADEVLAEHREPSDADQRLRDGSF